MRTAAPAASGVCFPAASRRSIRVPDDAPHPGDALAQRSEAESAAGPTEQLGGAEGRSAGTVPSQTGRAAQSSHLPFGLAGPLNISQLPQAVAAAPDVKKRQPLQILPSNPCPAGPTKQLTAWCRCMWTCSIEADFAARPACSPAVAASCAGSAACAAAGKAMRRPVTTPATDG